MKILFKLKKEEQLIYQLDFKCLKIMFKNKIKKIKKMRKNSSKKKQKIRIKKIFISEPFLNKAPKLNI